MAAKILVIEDNRANMELITDLLEATGTAWKYPVVMSCGVKPSTSIASESGLLVISFLPRFILRWRNLP